MRATLADARLAGYAGQFVWLALDFDDPANAAFIARHGTAFTPTFYVLDPVDEHATATQLGAMTVDEVGRFLDRGLATPAGSAADLALARGDADLASDRRDDAVREYAAALEAGGRAWPDRERAIGALTSTSMLLGRWRPCAETAAGEALGRSWLLQLEAKALVRLNRRDAARAVLDEALRAAHEIGVASARERNVAAVTRSLAELR